MSIGGFSLLASNATASSSPQATASFTPTASGIVFIGAYIRYTSGNSAPTIAANGISSPTVISSIVDVNNSSYVQHFWRADGVASAGTLTFTRAGSDAWDRMCWSIFQFTGQNATPLVAANTVTGNPVGAGGTLTINYAQAFAAGSAGVALFSAQGDFVASETPRSGWTEISLGASGGDLMMAAHYRLTSDTAGGVTWPVSDVDRIGIVVELAQAGGGSPTLRRNTNLDGLSASGGFFGNPLGMMKAPKLSFHAYQRDRARPMREFMAKIRRAA